MIRQGLAAMLRACSSSGLVIAEAAHDGRGSAGIHPGGRTVPVKSAGPRSGAHFAVPVVAAARSTRSWPDAGIRTVFCNARTRRINAIMERWIGDAATRSWDRTLVRSVMNPDPASSQT
jgi:hypothetical protein